MIIYAGTQKGVKRKKNEDCLGLNGNIVSGQNKYFSSFNIQGSGKYIFTIADGMGGYKGGDFASKFTSSEIFKKFSKYNEKFDPAVCLDKVDQKLYEMSLNNNNLMGMGTTIICAIFNSETVHSFNVGDSPLFYYNNSKLKKISKDDNLPGLSKSVITQSIGNNRGTLNVHEKNFNWELGSYLIILSDGVSDQLRNAEIKDLISIPNVNKAELLINRSIEKGSSDDLSAIIIENTSNP